LLRQSRDWNGDADQAAFAVLSWQARLPLAKVGVADQDRDHRGASREGKHDRS